MERGVVVSQGAKILLPTPWDIGGDTWLGTRAIICENGFTTDSCIRSCGRVPVDLRGLGVVLRVQERKREPVGAEEEPLQCRHDGGVVNDVESVEVQVGQDRATH